MLSGNTTFFVKLNTVKLAILWSLFCTDTYFVAPLYEVYLLCNSLDFMFILQLLWTVTCLLRPWFSVEKTSALTKQFLLLFKFNSADLLVSSNSTNVFLDQLQCHFQGEHYSKTNNQTTFCMRILGLIYVLIGRIIS